MEKGAWDICCGGEGERRALRGRPVWEEVNVSGWCVCAGAGVVLVTGRESC